MNVVYDTTLPQLRCNVVVTLCVSWVTRFVSHFFTLAYMQILADLFENPCTTHIEIFILWWKYLNLVEIFIPQLKGYYLDGNISTIVEINLYTPRWKYSQGGGNWKNSYGIRCLKQRSRRLRLKLWSHPLILRHRYHGHLRTPRLYRRTYNTRMCWTWSRGWTNNWAWSTWTMLRSGRFATSWFRTFRLGTGLLVT